MAPRGLALAGLCLVLCISVAHGVEIVEAAPGRTVSNGVTRPRVVKKISTFKRRSPAVQKTQDDHARCARVMARVPPRVEYFHSKRPAGWEDRIEDLIARQEFVCAPVLLYRECTNAQSFVDAAKNWCSRRGKNAQACINEVTAHGRIACRKYDHYLRTGKVSKRKPGPRVKRTMRERRNECRLARRLTIGGRIACKKQRSKSRGSVMSLYTCIHEWRAHEKRKCDGVVFRPEPTQAPFDVRAYWARLSRRHKRELARLSNLTISTTLATDNHAFIQRARCEAAKARLGAQLNECNESPRCEKRLKKHVITECAEWLSILNSWHTSLNAGPKRVACKTFLEKRKELKALCGKNQNCQETHSLRVKMCNHKLGLIRLHKCKRVHRAHQADCKGDDSCPAIVSGCQKWLDNRCAHVRVWNKQCTVRDNASGCTALWTTQLAQFGCANTTRSQ